MLQVRLHHAPAPAQVFVEPVFGEVCEHPPHFLGRWRLRVEFGIARYVTDCQATGADRFPRYTVEGEFLLPCQGCVERTAQQRHMYEIVEMPRLQ
jgi:hypothetical protein